MSGITDPFLQVKVSLNFIYTKKEKEREREREKDEELIDFIHILKFLRILGKGDAEASDQMNDILAQVFPL